jgi:hypothetical protein
MGTDIEWRWADPSGQQRRVRTDELRAALASGVIAPNTPVWRRGWKQWQPARDVPELTTSALAAAQGLVPNIPPPPLAVVAVQAQFEAEANDDFSSAVASEPPPPPTYVPAAIPPSTGQQRPSVAPPPGEGAAKSVRPPATRSVRPPPAGPAVPASPASSSKDVGAAADASGLGKALPTAFGVPALDAAGHGASLPLSSVATPAPPAPAVPPASPAPATRPGKPGKASTLVVDGAPPQASPSPSSARHPINVPPPTVTADPDMVEELSGSAIIPDSVSNLQAAAARKNTVMGLQPPAQPYAPPTDPVVDAPAPPLADDTEPHTRDATDEHDAAIPRGLRQILHDMRKLQPRNKFVLPVAGGVGALGLLMLFGLVIRACTKKDDDAIARSSGSGSATAGAHAGSSALGTVVPARSVDVPPPPPVAQPATPSGGACKVEGSAKVISPRVVPQPAVEVAVHGSQVALGFATTPKEGLAVQLDPATLEVAQTAKAATNEAIKRVVPINPNAKLAVLVEGDKRPKRTLWTDTPIDVGLVKGSLVASPFGQATFTKLFPVDGAEPLDALRGAALDGKAGKGYVIAFRRAQAVWLGAFAADPMAARGPLLRVAGLGAQVGQPAIAASGDAVMAAWADRVGPSDPWAIRWVRFAPGELAPAPKDFSAPAGGLGSNVMAPALVGLDGNRFLLAWTEGPATNHQVRALTLGPDGQAIGDPVAISPEGSNAGQAQAAVLGNGRGVVAYLALKGKGFEVVAVPIRCN